MKTIYSCFKVSVTVALIFLFTQAFAQLKINEYSAANKTTIANGGQYYDWFEVYNPTGASVNIGGWYLSDDPADLLKWQVPAGVTVNANGYRIFYCSGRGGLFSGQYHTSFKIEQSDTAEFLVLTNSGGTIVDSTTVFPCRADQSRGRSTNGGATWAVFQTPTPNASNTTQTAYVNYVPKVQFSLAAGFYSGTQSVSLSCPQSNVTIRYTTNGAIPSTTSTLYSGPISITATTALRARAFDNNNQYAGSFTETNTYFINETHTLPVISATSSNFTNLFNTGQDITGTMEFFSTAGQQVFEIEGDFNKHGNDSWAYPQKGVDFNVEDEYGQGDQIQKKMFYTSPRKKFKWLILKAAASDNFPGNAGSHPAAHIRDAYIQTLAEKFNLDVDMRRMDHALLFINGQYWGVYEYRERVDADYFDYYYDQQEQYVDDLQYWGGLVVKYGSDTAWANLYNYVVANSMTNPVAYQHVIDRLDPMSLIDATVLSTYSVNTDWLNWNTAWWRGRKMPNNVRWKYWLWDMDNTFNLGQNYTGWPNGTGMTNDPCDVDQAGYNNPNIGPNEGHIVILNKLRQNPQFEQMYINRYADLINTAFACPNMLAHFDTMIARIQPEMQRQCTRWSGSYTAWMNNVNFMRNQISSRCNAISGGLITCYNLTGPYAVAVNVFPACAGDVTVNSLHPDEYPFHGSYYGGVNQSLQANPAPGWQFDHWQMTHTPSPNTTSDSIWFDLSNAGDSIVAVFTQINPTPGTLYVNITGTNPGAVTINGTPVADNQTYTYTLGTQLNVTATPVPGCTFYQWQPKHTLVYPIDTAETGYMCFRENDTLKVVFDDCLIVPDSLTVIIQQPSYGAVTINSIPVSISPVTVPVNAGTLLNLVATPNAGYTFSNWQTFHHSISPNNTSATASFTFNQRDTLYAIFLPPDTFNLTVMVTPAGGGNATVNGVTPPSYPTVMQFVSGTALTLQAVANTGYTFTNWSILHHTLAPNNTSANAGFTITQDDTLTANFTANPVPDTFNLTVMVSPLAGGNVSVNGTTPPAYPTVLQFVDGTLLNLQALANTGYTFTNWVIQHHTLNPNNTSANASFTITQDDTLLANFTLNPTPDTFNLTVMVNPAGGGNVTVNGTTPVAYPTVLQYVDGTLLNISAAANAGYTFNTWSLLHHTVSINNGSNPGSFVITQDDTLMANFTVNPDTFKLTVLVAPAGGGNVTVNGNLLGSYPITLQFVDGTSINISETANTGFNFTNWTLLNHALNPNNTSPVANFVIHADDTLTANYAVIPNVYDLVLQAVPANAGTMVVNGTTYSSFPTTIQVTENTVVNAGQSPTTGFLFNNWNLVYQTLNPNNTANPVNFTMTQSDTLYAYYSIAPPDTFSIVVDVKPNIFAGDVAVAGFTPPNHQYPYVFYFPEGTNVDFDATGLNAYTFSHYDFIYHNPQPNANQSVVFINVQQPDTVIAYFNEGVVTTDSAVQVLVPSAFSPDGSGVNDVFRVFTIPPGNFFEDYSMQIYNRWGQKVFESNSQGHGWAGDFNGKKCEMGVYSYILTGKLLNGEEIKKKGAVTLLR